MLDKRSHMRVSVRIPVCCVAGGQVTVAGVVTDISLGGSCVRSDERLPHGTKVTMVVRLPGADHESRMPGIVRWTAPGYFGVEFSGVDARDTYYITNLMRVSLRSGPPSAGEPEF